MGHVMIKCPKTGNAIFTGLIADRESFAVMPVFFGRVPCPTCGAIHEWFARDAWVHDVSPGSERMPKPLAQSERSTRNRASPLFGANPPVVLPGKDMIGGERGRFDDHVRTGRRRSA
jgi:hypothetical protein